MNRGNVTNPYTLREPALAIPIVSAVALHRFDITQIWALRTDTGRKKIVIAIPVLQLGDLPKDDPKRADILEMRKAGHAAIALLPELSERMR